MNKFLLLAIAAFALGTAFPTMANDHAMNAEHHMESTMDHAEDATDHVVEICSDAEGNEIECPTEEDMSHDHEAHDDMEHQEETTY